MSDSAWEMFNLRNIVMERTGEYQVSECQTRSLQNFRLRSVRRTGRERRRTKSGCRGADIDETAEQHTQLIITPQPAPANSALLKYFFNNILYVKFWVELTFMAFHVKRDSKEFACFSLFLLPDDLLLRHDCHHNHDHGVMYGVVICRMPCLLLSPHLHTPDTPSHTRQIRHTLAHTRHTFKHQTN